MGENGLLVAEIDPFQPFTPSSRRPTSQPTKGPDETKEPIWKKTRLILLLLLPIRKDFEVGFATAPILSSRQPEKHQNNQDNNATGLLTTPRLTTQPGSVFGVEKLNFLHYLDYLQDFECLFD